MKQTVNTAQTAKQDTDKAASKVSALSDNKTEANLLLKLKKTKRFNRFLEASCDCV